MRDYHVYHRIVVVRYDFFSVLFKCIKKGLFLQLYSEPELENYLVEYLRICIPAGSRSAIKDPPHPLPPIKFTQQKKDEQGCQKLTCG